MQAPDAALLQAVAAHQRLLFCIKGSPDPDALASSFACSLILSKLNKSCRIVATQGLALQQNREFAKRLSLSFEVAPDFARFAPWADAYLVLDHASPVVDGLSGKRPCAAHIDHHDAVETSFPIAMRWCRTDVGSTATLVAQLLERCHERVGLSSREMRRITTALLFGLQTDTDQYLLANDTDYAAVKFLSRFADAALLKKLTGVPMDRTTSQRLERAERNHVNYKDWLFAGVGYIPEHRRDDIAIIADKLLRRPRADLVVVFALVEDERRKRLWLDASVRSSDSNLRLSHVIRLIASDGGGRHFKGAFQVKLDYFADFSEREALWKLVEQVTLHKLKGARDAHLKVRLQGLLESASESATQFFSTLAGGIRSTLSTFRSRNP